MQKGYTARQVRSPNRVRNFILFVISLILNVIAARYIFIFYNYTSHLEIEKTGSGLLSGLFSLVLIPGIFVVYPVLLFVCLLLIAYYYNGSKDKLAIFLPWAFILLMYAPALLSFVSNYRK